MSNLLRISSLSAGLPSAFPSLWAAFLFIAIALSGCGSGKEQQKSVALWDGVPTTAPWIVKSGTILNTHGETTPVIFGGALLYISCDRNAAGIGSNVNVFDKNAVIITSIPARMAFCSALVTPDGVLHVFGSTLDSIVEIQTANLISWTAPSVMIAAPKGVQFFNTSVTPDSTGYVMAYEVCSSSIPCYSFRIAYSSNLKTWGDIGILFDGIHYAECPTIRYSNGYYYVVFLGAYANGVYSSKVVRSADLFSWEIATQDFISPLDGGDFGNNASDVDLVDLGGTVLIVYENNSQVSNLPGTGTRLATFTGTMDGLFTKFTYQKVHAI